jgi:hypothetical protein
VKRSILGVAAGLLLVASGAAAQSKQSKQSKSVAGIWNASVTTPNGGGNPVLTFAVKGDSVTGTVKRPTGEVVPLRGTIKGSDLTYSYTIAPNGQEILVTVKAKVVGDSLGGTMSFGGAMMGQITAKRAK